MASFLNCMTWRVVHGESVLRGRSHCDACGHVLGARDLVPIVSYLVSGGRCRYCGAKLSSRHVWGEVIGAAVFVSLLLHYDISLRLLEAWLLASILLACSFADLEGYIIPDRFLAAGLVLFIASLFFAPAPLVTGLFFGWKGNLLCLILACIFGIVFGLLAAGRGGEKGAPIPWGPSIALGAWVTALAGEPFIRWYLSLL